MSTITPTDAATPALLELRPKVAAIEVMSSSDCAWTVMSPLFAVTCAPSSTCAVVWRTITPTSRPMPTPALPEEAPMPPAALNTVIASCAETVTP